MKNAIRWPIALLVGGALILPAVALARTTHWAGTVNYGVIDSHGDRVNYDIDFNVSHGKVTYWWSSPARSTAARPAGPWM